MQARPNPKPNHLYRYKYQPVHLIILLLHMTRQIPPGIILMDKRAIHDGHALQHILETLPQIMTIPQTRILIENDIDLDVQLVASVVGLYILDLGDGLGEAHGEVEEDVALVGGGGGAGEVADVRGAGAGPVGDDEQRE